MISAPASQHYYRSLWRKARQFRVDMSAKQWCDLWHAHFDWDGKGDESWLDRRKHVRVLLHALARARRELKSFGGPYQLFATVHPASSADDAIYVHTENPNGTPFPCEHTGAIPVASLPQPLAGEVSLIHYEVLSLGSGKEKYFVLIPRET